MRRDLLDTSLDAILDAGDYAAFKRLLIASNCQRCELGAGRTHLVVDRGNPNARVMLIGEGPGENEDLQGKAFVGRAGKLLDEMFREMGFDTDKDALIANVVKSRPPGNRAPKPEEVRACFPYLLKQIELVKPSLIGLLGATALKHVLKNRLRFSMKDEVGKFFAAGEFPGIQFMVLYHPAYILRDPRKKPLMREHLCRLVSRWKQTVSSSSPKAS